MKEVFHEAVGLLEKDDQLVVATVIRTSGSTPQKPGAKLLVRNEKLSPLVAWVWILQSAGVVLSED